MKKKLSLIVPAYNAESYIESCLRELFSLTYENYDVIVVDDGSTDQTYSILTSMNEPILKVIHQENAGVSAARNTGLSQTDADYVMFVDVDDVLLPQALDDLLQQLRFDSDVYMFAYEHEENGTVRKIPLPLVAGSYTGDETARLCERLIDVKFSKNYTSGYFGAKVYQYLFSTKFLCHNELQFPIGLPFAEDCVFCYRVFQNMPSLTIIDRTAYRYIVNPNSASHKYRKNFWKEIKQYYYAICNANNGREPDNKAQIFFYYYNDIIERAVCQTAQIGKAEVQHVIQELYEDTEFCKAAASVSFADLSVKEKLERTLYRLQNQTLTYLFFWGVQRIRTIRKAVKSRE